MATMTRPVSCSMQQRAVQSEARFFRRDRKDRARDHLRENASGISASSSGISGSSGKLSRDMPAMRVRERPQTKLAH